MLSRNAAPYQFEQPCFWKNNLGNRVIFQFVQDLYCIHSFVVVHVLVVTTVNLSMKLLAYSPTLMESNTFVDRDIADILQITSYDCPVPYELDNFLLSSAVQLVFIVIEVRSSFLYSASGPACFNKGILSIGNFSQHHAMASTAWCTGAKHMTARKKGSGACSSTIMIACMW